MTTARPACFLPVLRIAGRFASKPPTDATKHVLASISVRVGRCGLPSWPRGKQTPYGWGGDEPPVSYLPALPEAIKAGILAMIQAARS
jgi:hypothetical protein